jgi:hypothetical protein
VNSFAKIKSYTKCFFWYNVIVVLHVVWGIFLTNWDFKTYLMCKAVGRGDKTTRRVRARVLALLENPWRDRVRVLTLQENPRRERVRDLAIQKTLAKNECSIAGSRLETRQWTSSFLATHRTLVLWRRWLQALGLFYKKNMPNNNTAYPICKINLSFISFLCVE